MPRMSFSASRNSPQGVAEEMVELVGQDLARGHVVAVGEAAGDDQDLVVLQQPAAARAGG